MPTFRSAPKKKSLIFRFLFSRSHSRRLRRMTTYHRHLRFAGSRLGPPGARNRTGRRKRISNYGRGYVGEAAFCLLLLLLLSLGFPNSKPQAPGSVCSGSPACLLLHTTACGTRSALDLVVPNGNLHFQSSGFSPTATCILPQVRVTVADLAESSIADG